MPPPMLSRGDVVLTQFPFTDLTGASLRPALVVSPGQIGEDVVLTAISSVVRGSRIPTDYLLETSHPEFPLTGLRTTSVFRLHKLVTVERSVIVRRLGRIGPQSQAEVDRLLPTVLGL
ncbi:MAG: type II toxin-antitoxin system PemK/MazF family toxin [Deltaproteobacteria bacterium]|nr:type II toxin-antitoxin system PemK/MazF family toxin [Deltaproteobacteria bacterium]